MSVTHATAVRSALADLIDTLVNTGSGTAVLRLRDSTTTIVDFDLQDPAFGAASSGVITLEGTPIAATAEASGDVDNAQLLDQDGGTVLSCSVTGTGGGGDIEVSNVSIANGQDCSLTSLTYTAAP